MVQTGLLNCKLFEGIKEADLAAILVCLNAVTRNYSKGDFVMKAGSSPTNVGVVTEGCVHIMQEDYWGNRTLIEQVASFEVFGEAFACAETERLPLSIMAAKDTSILFIDYKRIITTCSSACAFHAHLIKNMVSSMAQRNLALMKKIEHTNKRNIREKLLSYFSTQALLGDSSSFEIPFSRQELADYLAVDRASLSRSLSAMEDDGLVDLQGRRVTLLKKNTEWFDLSSAEL